ncbi:MAG: hypothetical protein CL503_05930 [Actinobacteria bacterium]|nr:hypothetical protein [Actinomycetota bacterium]|tara:strand:- start:5568 stop:6026 length:459 start_codon:yes stop_codon:yes gene_type:complete
MSNELSDTEMITKKVNGKSITFDIKDTVDIIWMSQKTLATFFESPFKSIIKALSIILDETPINKTIHIRTISYIDKQETASQSIQETQYSSYIILLLAFKLNSPTAKAFQQWIIESQFNLIKNGFIIDKTRLKNSEKRFKKFQQQVKKLTTS